MLAKHFVKIYSEREKKTVTSIADHVLKTLLNYDWPGNIRQLENVIARSVLLASGTVLDSVKLPGESKSTMATPQGHIKSMTENERDHILSALGQCNWRVYGQGGAAELLDLNPSTLNSRMKKLGIEKKYFRPEGD
ncbi:DNA-binding transcriptional response regulator [Pedobacter rhizosphaerae]|uniref:Regulatory protein, Fis family n=1 Tax=Pedobacter rhizosphaerae TaxID=390241 RepID=A0A1H9SHY2_9SPHI|nr:helix-turn-helix domain-containing protein [Pedobacter rhizosphaerae]SER83829.1 regulatory protein, Fis family [Pedobacter rhizosphaerae]